MKRYIKSSYTQDDEFESSFYEPGGKGALYYADYLASIASAASKYFPELNRIIHVGYSVDHDITFKMLGSRFHTATLTFDRQDVLDTDKNTAVSNVVNAFRKLIENGSTPEGIKIEWQRGHCPK